MYLDAPRPADIRLRHARRVRNAARSALRNIEQLSVEPENWVVDRLVELETFTQQLIQELSVLTRGLAVH